MLTAASRGRAAVHCETVDLESVCSIKEHV